MLVEEGLKLAPRNEVHPIVQVDVTGERNDEYPCSSARGVSVCVLMFDASVE
jgi:hypothetical protein